MKIELLKRFAEICNELNEAGAFGISEKRLHVREELISGMENLQIRDRGDSDFPYEIFTVIEGVKIFAIIKTEQLKNFPQFKENAKAILRKQLAVLEEEEAAV